MAILLHLVPIHAVEFLQDLRVGDFHIVEPIQHLFDTFESLLVTDGDTTALQLSFDLAESLGVLLYNQRST